MSRSERDEQALIASVRDRLRNVARKERSPFESVLVRYGIERLLYRLSVADFADRYVLKGAQLLLVHAHGPHRPTRDVDLLGFGPDDEDAIASDFRFLCTVPVRPDGLTFAPDSVAAAPIRTTDRYGGVRVRLQATLGRSRIPIQVDVGFGDVVTPGTESATFPTLLDHPAPHLATYPLATVVAEKIESLARFGVDTSRMKDVYDLWYIVRTFPLNALDVRRAIVRTFAHRGTDLGLARLPFTETFHGDPELKRQWAAFRQQSGVDAPDLPATCDGIERTIGPLLQHPNPDPPDGD